MRQSTYTNNIKLGHGMYNHTISSLFSSSILLAFVNVKGRTAGNLVKIESSFLSANHYRQDLRNTPTRVKCGQKPRKVAMVK
jgi:hypothetical protein